MQGWFFPESMRFTAILLACTLFGCSTNYSVDSKDLYKPDTTPLGSLADKNRAPADSAPHPASTTNRGMTASRSAWPAPFEPAAGKLCARVAARSVSIRMQPRATAVQFGQLPAGGRVQLAARTADGWVGFDPGSAQAANVGIFRLRWVLAAEAFAPGDSCQSLPLVVAPPAGCLLLAPRPMPVREQPASGASLLSTIPAGSYARVVAQLSGPGQWVEVLVPGKATHGFVTAADASFSGPCQ